MLLSIHGRWRFHLISSSSTRTSTRICHFGHVHGLSSFSPQTNSQSRQVRLVLLARAKNKVVLGIASSIDVVHASEGSLLILPLFGCLVQGE